MKINFKFRIFIIMICAAAFLVIGICIKNFGSLPFDAPLCEAFYAMRTPALTKAVKAVTYAANWQTITLICILLLFFKRTRGKYGYPLALSAIASSLLYKGMKEIFERPRPDEALRLVTEAGYSFPSGHSMTGLVFYGLLAYLLCINAQNLQSKKRAHRTAALFCILILLIGASRIYLGVHYPSDVLGGLSLGTALLFLIFFVVDAQKSAAKEEAL